MIVSPSDTAKYAPDAKIIHIDIDASEFDKTVKSYLHLHGDARSVMQRLLPLINTSTPNKYWIESFSRHKKVEEERVIDREINASTPDGKMLMGEVVSIVSKIFDDNAILVTDVGQNQMFGVRYFDSNLREASYLPVGLALWDSVFRRL